MSYKAKTLSGAQRRVRDLEKLVEKHKELLTRFDAERKLMARLAADTPQFSNPLMVYEAKKTRDEILKGSR